MSSRLLHHLDLDNLPVNQKYNLSKMLDQNDSWEELGKLMQFSDFDIANLRVEAQRLHRSPSDVLISRWSSRYDHNVTELFKLLSIMQHFQAMEEIKNLVDIKYHVWFEPVQPNFTRLLEDKQLNVKSQIFTVKKEELQENHPKEDFKENMKELLNIPEIPFEQLEEATNKWAEENILGSGGFGTVFKGEWISTVVAIKRLEYQESKSGSSKDHLIQSLNEMRHLNHCRHDNILPIYGYAMKDDTVVVVCQLMPGGSLESRLLKRGCKPLTWPQRWHIAKGTARGLQYLHRYSERPLIHGDIKPANILLDACYEPKIGDFGLSRVGHVNDECQELSKVFGTKPYLPYEFLKHSLFSTKVDVFSFGVVLFELATSFKARDSDRKDPFLFDHMARIDESSIEQIMKVMDSTVPRDEACVNLCKLMVILGKSCTNHNPNFRPEMMAVFKALDKFTP